MGSRVASSSPCRCKRARRRSPPSVRAQDGPEQQRRDGSQREGEGKRVSSGHVQESGGEPEVIAEARSIDEAPGEGQRQQDAR